MAKAGFYAVAKGRVPGIYASWDDCEDQVKGFNGARYKKFRTLREAEQFVGVPSSSSASASTLVASPSRSISRFDPVKRVLGMSKDSKTISPEDAVSEEGYDVVYADGACKGNGKVGSVAGVGVWWGHNDPRNIAERCPGAQTNNRAELIAIVRALEQTPACGRPLMIKTDSTYSIKCLREWHQSWDLNGWKTKSGKPVLNAGIIRYLLSLLSLRHLRGSRVKLVYVKGHAGIEGNEGADRQANLGTRLPRAEEPNWDAKRTTVEKESEELELGVEVNDKAVQVMTVIDEDDELWKNVGDIDVEVMEEEESQVSAASTIQSAPEPDADSTPAPTPVTKTDDESETPTKPSELTDTAYPKQNEPATQSSIAIPDSDDYSVDDLLSPDELEAELADA